MRVAVLCIVAVLSVSGAAWAAEEEDEIQRELQEESEAAKAPVKKKAEKKEEEKQAEVKKTPEKKDVKKDEPVKAEDFTCPESIKVEAQKADKKSVPAGFASVSESVTYWLDSVSVYAGEKLEKREPDKSSDSASSWMLHDNGKTHYFLGCGYRDTSVILKKALPATFKNCHVAPKANPANPHGPQVLHAFGCDS